MLVYILSNKISKKNMPKNKMRISPIIKVFTIALLSFLVLSVFPAFKINAEIEDATPPNIDDVLLSKNIIDTDEASDTVTVYARISDDFLGVSEASGYITYVLEEGDESIVSGHWVSLALMEDNEACALLDEDLVEGLGGICGDLNDGVFSGEATFLQGTKIGNWILGSVSASDSLNMSTNQMSEFPERDFIIVNIAETEDVTGPTYVDYAFDKATINTEAGEDTLTFYIRLTDEMSGVASSQNISFKSEETNHSVEFSLSLMEDNEACALLGLGLADCGNASDGIYSGSATFPQYVGKGLWVSNGAVISDNLGNQKDIAYYDGFDATFTNEATIDDGVAPVITSISVDPIYFNTAEAEAVITIEVGVEDEVSGVSEIMSSISPIIGSQSVMNSPSNYVILSGNANEGVFQITLTVPQYSKVGIWNFGGVAIWDNVGNQSNYGIPELMELFPNFEESVLVNQALSNTVTVEQDWIIDPGVYRDEEQNLVWPGMIIRFEEGTEVTKQEGGYFAFYRMISMRYDLVEYTDFNTFLATANEELATELSACDVAEGCDDTQLSGADLIGDPLHVVKFGIPGLGLSFSKPVDITLRMEEEDLGKIYIIQTYSIETEGWDEETTCTVAMVEPYSYEHGGDEYGEIMPAPYPACRFSIDHASYFSINDGAGVPDGGYGGLKNNWFELLFGWLW